MHRKCIKCNKMGTSLCCKKHEKRVNQKSSKSKIGCLPPGTSINISDSHSLLLTTMFLGA